MAKVTPITEHFQHFVKELQESFWGDLQGQVQQAAKKFFELLSERQRDLYMVSPRYARPEQRKDYRNGYYTRDFVTRFGTLRLRIARTRKKGFLPAVIKKFQRRAEEVALLIREAFLRGMSTRQVGRVVGVITEERVSPQTVSRITQHLDQAVQQFHQARLEDDWAYLFLDGVSLRVRRPVGRKRVQMLVAYGVKRDGRRELLAFLRTRGESQADWESLLQDLFRRGLEGKHLQLIVTDGCPGLGAAIQTVYPRALHQRCWAHKMRNITEKVKKRDFEQVKTDAQAIYQADNRKQAQAAGRHFCRRWQQSYPSLVRQLERDLPELLSFFALPRPLWKKLRTTNIIERCFVEVRRRTRPMVCFVNVQSVDRIIYSIFQRFNL
ncbi:MAG TPA: IS256 family transposase, partial [Candidatus Angelobacter sp.]|nr:IS256 family transposase [Candidatus Angelobacter sp.]